MSSLSTSRFAHRDPPALHSEPRQFEGHLHEALAELNSYRAALNRHAIVGITDRGGRIIEVNDLFCEISQYSRAELIGQQHRILNSGHHPKPFFRDMWRTISSGESWHGDICNRAKDGSLYWVDTTIMPRKGAEGSITGYVSIRYDITRRKQAEGALQEENCRREQVERLLRDILEALPNGITAYDESDRLVLFNSAYREFYGLTAPAIYEGASFESILRYGLERGQFLNVRGNAAARESWLGSRLKDHRTPGRTFIQHLSGDRWLQVQERRSPGGYVVGVRTDVTELKRAERKIKEQAARDSLTGLYNRRATLERLERAVEGARRDDPAGALLLLDLDGFKHVNDTLGHDAGDEMLVRIAMLLQSALRKTDFVARLGGDEFAILLCNMVSEASVRRIAEKLLRLLQEPLEIGGKSLVPAASFGIALFPQHGSSATELMKHADLALYRAKDSGRRTYAIYTPDLSKTNERRVAMVEAIKRAMAQDKIQIALQPQVNMVTGRHDGFEALVRWQRGARAVPPPELISAAEEGGLILPLGYLIFEKALAATRSLLDAGLDPGRVAVNVTAAQLREPEFPGQVIRMLEQHRLLPQHLEIEVTENVVLDRMSDRIVTTLRELDAAGIRIALDDFGTGYASLAHLKRFPIHRLKIDRTFVREVTTDCEDAIIARTIISLAHSLGMTVVAEGIETEEQYQLLSNLGCDFAQGYLISRPVALSEANRHLAGRAGLPPPGSD